MKKKLLVVDDDAEVREVMSRSFQQAGYEVIEAADGHMAADWIEWEHPDLVLLDVGMPKLNGMAALDEILDIDPGMPVIMVTGDADATQARRAMEKGACAYVTKPFDMRALEASVAANL